MDEDDAFFSLIGQNEVRRFRAQIIAHYKIGVGKVVVQAVPDPEKVDN
jgi:hypothetical protein